MNGDDMTVNTRAVLRTFALSAALFLLTSVPANAENLLSLQVGAFAPGGDYRSNKDDGGDFGIFYTNTSRMVGFEAGMHGYRTKLKGQADVGVVGAEFLITFQNPMASLQPYAGLGVGFYSVEVDYDSGLEETHQGNGLVAEVGVRGYMESMFIGFQVKGFTNDGDDAGILPKGSDYGGVSATMVLGIIF